MPTDPVALAAAQATERQFVELWQAKYAERHAAQLVQEAQRRDEAFARQPHTVCGLALRGMTPQDLLLLHGIGSPFVCGGERTAAAVAQFLWVMWTGHEWPPPGWLARFGYRLRRRAFFAHVARLDYAGALAEMEAFLERTFADAPPPPVRPDPQPLGVCFLAGLVLTLAIETGWTEAAILAMRLDCIFQYQKIIRARNSPAGHFDPGASGQLLKEALADFTAQMQPARAA